MPYKRLQIVAFFVFLLILLILVILVLRPFVSILALSLILAILIGPLQDRILRVFSSRTVAALLAIIIVTSGIVLIFTISGRLLIGEISGLVNRVQSGDLVISRDHIVQSIPFELRSFVENATKDLNNIISRITSTAFNSVSVVVSNVASFFLAVFLVLFTTFYLLRDGPHIKKLFLDLSPLATRQEDILFKRIVQAVNGVIKGQFLTAIVQGFVATAGFFIFGVPNPVLWGFFTILAALVPTIGTALAIVPAVIYLLITGQVPQAVGLAIWGFFAVGLIDNFIGPKLVGSQTRLHPLLVLLSVLGGLEFFGVLGFLIGPILMAIFVATVDIYRTDFKDYFFG
jgi:predicted PurR-regulated permease PerM